MSRRQRPDIRKYLDQALPGASWNAWKAIIAASYGLPLSPERLKIFERVAGYPYDPPKGGYKIIEAICAIQSGKTQVAATLVGFEGMFPEVAPDTRDGTYTNLRSVLVAQDARGVTRTMLARVRAVLRSVPAFAAQIASDTADAITLKNGVQIGAWPCRPEAVRGVRANFACADELAFFKDSVSGRGTSHEMVSVLMDRLVTTRGRLWIITSPWAEHGKAWELYRDFFGKAKESKDARILVLRAPLMLLNPTVDPADLERKRLLDPLAARADIDAEFIGTQDTLLDRKMLEACTDETATMRAPNRGTKYFATFDAATGGTSTAGDRATWSIAHYEMRDGRIVAVQDVIDGMYPPFDPATAIRAAAMRYGPYGVTRSYGDAYASGSNGGFLASEFKKYGITYEVLKKNRSEIYLDLLPIINSGSCVLLNHPEMLRELRNLERRILPSGVDRVDHPRRVGGHDDFANVAASALVLAHARGVKPTDMGPVMTFRMSFDGQGVVSTIGRPIGDAPQGSDQDGVGTWDNAKNSDEPPLSEDLGGGWFRNPKTGERFYDARYC